MYYLFHVHGWAPSQYYDKKQGERDLIWALASYEAEHRNDLLEQDPRLASILL